VKRRIRRLVLSLLPVYCLSLATLSFSGDAVGLESWRHRPNEGDFAHRIAGVYLLRHQTDEGTPGAFRLISLTAGGNWAGTNSHQHALFNLPDGFPFPFEDSEVNAFLFREGGDTFRPGVDVYVNLDTFLNPNRFSDQHGVWARSGWREMTAEVMDFNLDALTGVPAGIVRVRYVVHFSKDLQSVTGTQKGRVYALDQDPLDPETVPTMEFDSIFSGRRVTVEAE